MNTISIKTNTITNYIGQGYALAVAVIITPFYLQYLGAEAYGLVGFFIVMQNLLVLLDMGLSATLGRQVAYARGKIDGFNNFHHLLRSFELVFFIIALSTIVGIYFGSDWLGSSWIKSNTLDPDTVAHCINMIGILIGLRLFSTIYRSGINGFEDQVWINKASVVVNSLKYVGSFLIIAYVSSDIKYFFYYQILVCVLELTLLGVRFYRNLPMSYIKIASFDVEWKYFREIIPFTLCVAYTSAISMIITQFDKLVLSGSLPLAEFGYFSLIMMITGAIISLSTPVFLAFLPRMTILFAKRDLEEMTSVYINMTQIITWVTFSSAMLTAIYSREILYFLTGEKQAYVWGQAILFWYALGSGIYVLGTFQYYLQNAFGTLRLYVIGATTALFMLIPSIYFVTMKYGALGAGQLWFLFSLVWFLGWTFVVHNKLIPGFHFKWMGKDILPLISIIIALSYVLRKITYIDIDESRLIISIKIAVSSAAFLVITSMCVRSIRGKVCKKLKIIL